MSHPGQSSAYIGALLLTPSVFFGFGVAGIGEDQLTSLTGNFRLSKFILGALVSASVIFMVTGYIKMRDGIAIHRLD